jgi:hypothetical protein
MVFLPNKQIVLQAISTCNTRLLTASELQQVALYFTVLGPEIQQSNFLIDYTIYARSRNGSRENNRFETQIWGASMLSHTCSPKSGIFRG